MTLTSPASTDVSAIRDRRIVALKQDLALAYKECGPRLFNPNPIYGERHFIIADVGEPFDENAYQHGAIVHRSSLTEALTETEFDSLLKQLTAEGYHVKKVATDVPGHWCMVSRYEAGDKK